MCGVPARDAAPTRVSGHLDVVLEAARAVDDGVHSRDSGVDALAVEQVTDNMSGTVLGVAGATAEHPNVAPRGAQA